jgi:type II secretory pathway pseudopilin PulG
VSRSSFTLVETLASAVLVAMLAVAVSQAAVLVRSAAAHAAKVATLQQRGLNEAGMEAERAARSISSDLKGREHAAVPRSSPSIYDNQARNLMRGVPWMGWETRWIIVDRDGIGAARWIATPEGMRR